jgi:hypothetical protein
MNAAPAPDLDLDRLPPLVPRLLLRDLLCVDSFQFSALIQRGRVPPADVKLSAKTQYWRRSTVLRLLGLAGEADHAAE